MKHNAKAQFLFMTRVAPILAIAIAVACSGDSLSPKLDGRQNPNGPQTHPVPTRPSFSVSVPGNCYFAIPVTNINTALQGDTNTLCTFPDSAVVRISIAGSLTLAWNPDFSCCLNTANLSPSGTYGPMGGDVARNSWLEGLAKVRLYKTSGGPGTYSGAPTYAYGSTADSVVAFNTITIGAGLNTVYFSRTAFSKTASCSSFPANCHTPGGGLATFYTAPAYLNFWCTSCDCRKNGANTGPHTVVRFSE